ncbi:hypothetical protein [Nitratireductor sp. XY-223]|uniref:hypothetical protein n=1 Tax=Nitratireductor sp. XY-223 TaxID=2561926 RepID=UPI0010A9B642|nr:hypothetical protein [Nitratireductor sp. XY-223]
MCGLCGLLGIVHWAEISAHRQAFGGDGTPTPRSERIERTRLVNAALRPRRMKVGDFQATSYVVSSPTGRQEVVDDLQAVWSAVERLSGRPIDPLDEGYLRDLARVPA